MGPRVLIVDDDQDLGRFLALGLRARGLETDFCASAEGAARALSEQPFDVVMTDVQMEGLGGIDLCRSILEEHPNLPVVVMTAFGSLDSAVAALRAGASDFLAKPFDLDDATCALERALWHPRLREKTASPSDALSDALSDAPPADLEIASEGPPTQREIEAYSDTAAGELIGGSLAMRRVRVMIGRLEGSDATTLVTGETGTGKELVARALHTHSRRAAGPFVAFNCAAVPEALLESELFGHARGAFTGATSARVGLLAQASGGTLLLDEVAEMPINLQPKLLRALQERRFRPVGAATEVPFDVRIVAATNRNLEREVEERRFRSDLYFRLNVVHIEVPPLRARDHDVLELAAHFVRTFSRAAGKRVRGLTEEAEARLVRYDWPGNVRELANAVERAVALSDRELIDVSDLPERIRQEDRAPSGRAAEDGEARAESPEADLVPMDEIERRHVLRVMSAVGHNRTLAARILGLDRKTLYRKLERYGAREELAKRSP